jgi:SET domain-containing protein
MEIRKDIKDEYEYLIDESKIHGKGVFAKNKIDSGKKSLGMVLTNEGFLYSDLGRYINHSKVPNCKLIDGGDYNYFIVTTKDVNKGDEMIVNYDENPAGFQTGYNLDKDYFSLYEIEETQDKRLKYRYFTKLNENIKRIKELLF